MPGTVKLYYKGELIDRVPFFRGGIDKVKKAWIKRYGAMINHPSVEIEIEREQAKPRRKPLKSVPFYGKI
jgi:hypothetical protein